MRHTTKIMFALGAMLFAGASSLGACGSDDANGELDNQGDSLRGNGKDKDKKARACGGLTGLSCAKGEFCNYPEEAICGAADATGVCTTIAQVCADIYSPVCGCDDKTYGNACEASAASVSVASKGECSGSVEPVDAGRPGNSADSGSVSPATCGGFAGLKCAQGQWCNYEVAAGGTGCDGIADASGVCQPAFMASCTFDYTPVCGCDGKTYGNACAAHSAQVSIAKQGECKDVKPPVGKTCGGIANLQCATGEWCNYEVEAGGTGCVGIADGSGVCQPAAPQVCTREYNPVCGCDGKTYGNACTAHAAGASIATKGECKAVQPGNPPGDGKVCGGLLGGQCAKGEFCDFYGQTNDCGLADGTGICRTRPEICTLQYDPVCGCDGKTYGNACGANGAGVAVASKGECAAPAPASANCDQRDVLCKMGTPKCPGGTVPSVVGTCWGDCVAIEQCKCSDAPECPQSDIYSCHRSAGHCGPYVN